MTITIRGLTWDHPRAYAGLDAVTRRFNAEQAHVHLVWERHSLRAFEATPIEQLASRYDLITFDHPFIGDAVAAGCLADLEPFAAELGLDALRADSAGASYATYSTQGGQWALPIDAACQTAVARRDLIERLGAEAPVGIEDAIRFGERYGLGLALAVPHAFMNVLTIASLLGADISGEGERLFEPAIAIEAIELHRRLASFAPPAARGWSSIGLLEAMSRTDAVSWSPMVFCFNTYSRPDRPEGLAKLDFHDVAGLSATSGGPVIGGAGLAISAACVHPAAALKALAFLTSRENQIAIAHAGGQPGRASAWRDHAADAANGGFFAGAGPSLDRAAVRPRYPGYIHLQDEAGALLLSDLANPGAPARDVANAIEAAHSRALQGGRAT